jgi:hypothetical protein
MRYRANGSTEWNLISVGSEITGTNGGYFGTCIIDVFPGDEIVFKDIDGYHPLNLGYVPWVGDNDVSSDQPSGSVSDTISAKYATKQYVIDAFDDHNEKLEAHPNGFGHDVGIVSTNAKTVNPSKNTDVVLGNFYIADSTKDPVTCFGSAVSNRGGTKYYTSYMNACADNEKDATLSVSISPDGTDKQLLYDGITVNVINRDEGYGSSPPPPMIKISGSLSSKRESSVYVDRPSGVFQNLGDFCFYDKITGAFLGSFGLDRIVEGIGASIKRGMALDLQVLASNKSDDSDNANFVIKRYDDIYATGTDGKTVKTKGESVITSNAKLDAVTCSTPTANAHIANKKYVDDLIPRGFIGWFALEEAPDGWALCNGYYYSENGKHSSKDKTNGCTIKTPDLIGRYPRGSTTGIGGIVPASLPNIIGAFSLDSKGTKGEYAANGAFTTEEPIGATILNPSHSVGDRENAPNTFPVYFDASRCSTIYSNTATTVTPPSVSLLPCMKL